MKENGRGKSLFLWRGDHKLLGSAADRWLIWCVCGGGGRKYRISPLVVSVFCQLAAENEEFSGVDLKDYALYRSKIKLNQI